MHQPVEFTKNEIKFIRLNTGEDLISEVIEVKEEDDTYYILRNPLKVLYVTSKTSSLAISLMQWVFHRICEDQDFKMYPNDIIIMGKPTGNMLEYYLNSVDHFETVKEEQKRLIALEEHRKKYIQDSIEEEPLEDGEGIDMLKEFFDRMKKSNGGTLH
jgi:hypothetical protein